MDTFNGYRGQLALSCVIGDRTHPYRTGDGSGGNNDCELIFRRDVRVFCIGGAFSRCVAGKGPWGMNGYSAGLKFCVTFRGLANLVAFLVGAFWTLPMRGGFMLLFGIFFVPSRH
jgi:hypothetical protein